MGSKKKKTSKRTRVHANKKNVRRGIGLRRGRSAALRRTGYIQSKPGVLMGVYSMNIQRRLKKLQTLIPGGRSMLEVDVLLKKTADYIAYLKMQLLLLHEIEEVATEMDILHKS
uniref:BHLH domain-containing protein n=1 Tax=Picea sitchensis TaxID=3332 RepID=A9NTJ2_PICSI|nr:unknown [Picea sitchensis]